MVSTSGMIWSRVLLFPHSSVAVQVRVMVSVFPLPVTMLSLASMVTALQLSVPVATPVAVDDVSVVHSMVTLSGQLIDGAMVSSTVITCTR